MANATWKQVRDAIAGIVRDTYGVEGIVLTYLPAYRTIKELVDAGGAEETVTSAGKQGHIVHYWVVARSAVGTARGGDMSRIGLTRGLITDTYDIVGFIGWLGTEESEDEINDLLDELAKNFHKNITLGLTNDVIVLGSAFSLAPEEERFGIMCHRITGQVKVQRTITNVAYS